MSTQQHTNRLIDASSPYLLQHAHNPVDWYPWGDEALEAARQQDRPILVSIGYSACHWCHVMERESFENEGIARLMNESFVCIKVDREERPDLDEIYMTAVQMMTGSGGWPLNVFLTPEGVPFYGGTYFPPEDKWGRPGFRNVLLTVAKAYRDRRGEVDETAGRIRDALHAASRPKPAVGEPLTGELIEKAFEQLKPDFDPEWGGFGAAPKFPNAAAIALLLRYHHRTGSQDALTMATVTLDKMAQGGMYDQLGGGFARYSTDREWLVPHFEKMLYDNALLADAYLQAYQVTGTDLYAQIARETLDYVLRDMTDERGGFHSAEDADSEGEEGRFYIWDLGEVRDVLGPAHAQRFAEHYGMTDAGNFEGRNILYVPTPDPDARAKLAPMREKLLGARAGRVRPGKDDKVLTDWNGLMISALAKGYQVLEDERYRAAAQRAGAFILGEMRPDSGLLHAHRAGRSHIDGYLDDYAFVLQGLADLYEATFEPNWIRQAQGLAEEMIGRFWDVEEGGFYFTAADRADLITRPKKLHDGATPSGNAVAAHALLRLAEYTGNDSYRERAEATLRTLAGAADQAPRVFACLLLALDWHVHGSTQIVVSGKAGTAQTTEMLAAVRTPYVPNRVVAFIDPWADTAPAVREAIPVTADRPMADGQTAAYVCRSQVCLPPIQSAKEVVRLLKDD